MTATSPPERTRRARRPMRTWRAAVVVCASLLLAFSGTLSVANAEETPAPIVLNLSEGIGVGSTSGSVEGAQVAAAEPVSVADVQQVQTGILEPVAEGVLIADVVDVKVLGGTADLAVTANAQPVPVNAGATLTYTVALSNEGVVGAQAARFAILVPADLTFVSANGGFACAPQAGGVLCQSTQGASFTLASGASVEIHVAFTVAGGATGPLVATFTALTATADADADNDTATVTTAVNRAPSVSAAADGTAAEGAPASLGIGGFTDGSGDGPWTVTVDWGDGSPLETFTAAAAGALPARTHTYTEGPAEHAVEITVTDRWGLTGEATFTVDVANVAPTPVIAGAPGSIPEGTAVTLNGSATDPSAQDTAAGLTFAWVVTRDGAPFASASGGSITFTPPGAGTYAVELTATDDDGGSGSTAVQLTVVNRAPSLTAPDDQTVDEGVGTAIVLGGFTDASGDGPWTVAIDWGDGSEIQTFTVGAAGALVATPHTYAEGPAQHVVRVTVTDSWDLLGEASFAVEVRNLVPKPKITGAPASIPEGTAVTLTGSATDPSAQDTAAGFTFAWVVTRDGAPFAAGSGGSLSFAPPGAGTYTVELTATDDDRGSGSTALQITVVNRPPWVTAPADGMVAEGAAASIPLGGFTDASGDGPWTVTVDWGDGSPLETFTVTTAGALPARAHTYAEGPAEHAVEIAVTDRWGVTGEAAFTVDVTNVAPAPAIAGAPVTSPEGTALTLTGSATDPSVQDVSAGFTFAWVVTRDGAPFASGSGGSLTFTPSVEGTYAVALTATDADGGSRSTAVQITVTKAMPVVGALLLDQTLIDENGSVALSGTFTNPGSLETHTVVIAWGDGTTSTSLTLAPGVRAFSASHRYLDEDPSGTASDAYPISVTVSEGGGGSGSGSTAVTVRNVAPLLGPIVAAAAPQPVGTTLSASAQFSDVGTRDTHTGIWSWGDGTTSIATIGSGTASATHTYATAGSYTITLTLTDDDTGAATAVFTSVAVYDASASLTGGGNFTSPAGALAAEAAWQGRATFGLTARYARGEGAPSGNLELQLHGSASINFKSTAFEWLGVSGAQAFLRGSGTINGAGSYRFVLTTIDGQPGTGGDRIRVKIWDRATGNVVYDSGLGAPEATAPGTDLDGGSITHR